DILPARFWSKVEVNPDTGCWEWRAAKNPKGYGQFYWEGAMRLPHKVAYTAMVGPVNTGESIDHLCRVRHCCNPEHLESVAHLINVRRGRGPGSRTHCPQGHPYSGENLHIQSNGARRCLTCRRAHSRAYQQRLLENEQTPHDKEEQ